MVLIVYVSALIFCVVRASYFKLSAGNLVAAYREITAHLAYDMFLICSCSIRI